jgi:alkylhydroperoxidase family enzyme
MRTTTPRIAPLPPEGWTGEAGALIAPARRDGRAPPNLYTTLARNPAAMRSFVAFAAYVRSSSLPSREQELLILRIGWLGRSGYEWNAHNRMGHRAGLTDAEIARIEIGSCAPGWPPADALLLQAAEQIHADQFVGEPTWAGLREHFSEVQCMDVVFTASFYLVVCSALNSFGVQFDPGAALDPRIADAWGVQGA